MKHLKDHFKKSLARDKPLQEAIAKVIDVKPNSVYCACVRATKKPSILTQIDTLEIISKAYKTPIKDLIETK